MRREKKEKIIKGLTRQNKKEATRKQKRLEEDSRKTQYEIRNEEIR